MEHYILALDQGTTSSRCIIFNRRSEIVSFAQHEFKQYYPKPGWVEHDPDEIWDVQYNAAREAIAKAGLDARDIASVAITNQRETAVVWDRLTGKPVYNAIVWQCRRTADFCESLKKRGLAGMIKEKTGLVADAYFSGAKIKWILDNVPDARERAERGELLLGTIDTWLLWKLTGGKIHATDYTNASRTMLFNIKELKWDAGLLDIFGIPADMLPAVYPSSHIFGYTAPPLFGMRIPVSGIAGDQQAALFGQKCFKAGDVKNTYGTGCFMLMNTGGVPVCSGGGLLTTLACGTGEKPVYALEGSVFSAGSAIQWLRDELGIIGTAAESEEAASSVPDCCGVYLVPAFTGLGAPYWNSTARGMICNLTRGANRRHIIRAALEAIAYQTDDVLRIMKEDTHTKLSVLKADGGASANGFLLQFQSDISGIAVERPGCIETTALGAAYLAALSVGYFDNIENISESSGKPATFAPHIGSERRAMLLDGWHKAVKMALR